MSHDKQNESSDQRPDHPGLYPPHPQPILLTEGDLSAIGPTWTAVIVGIGLIILAASICFS